MRIGNNYQGIMQVFSRMSGKANTSNGYYCGNTIDNLRSGHFKNSYAWRAWKLRGKQTGNGLSMYLMK